METAFENEIGTFHMPAFGNRKVRYDRDTREHFIYWS